MRLFGPADPPVPRVFAVPPGVDFARAFARGLRARAGAAAPEAMAGIEVMVNTRRGARAIEAALAEAAGGPALLPRIALLSELGEDPLAAPGLPPAIDLLRRQLRLGRLVETYLAGAEATPAGAAPELAEALGSLLDELQEEGVDADALDGLVAGAIPEGAAAHWQATLRFIDIVRRHWPAILAQEEDGALDPKARQRLVIEGLAADWAAAPPARPVLAAGSTGSVASTAELLAAIARLPQGAVVLPGFDPGMEREVWQAIGPDHPFAPFRRLLGRLGLAPGDVAWWTDDRAETPRLRLLGQALRPAPVTDAWRRAAPALAAEAEAATDGLTLIEAPTPRHEAAALALAIRRALETPAHRVALVTPDAGLARRVTAELARYGVRPDDSLGRPLGRTPPGVFLQLIAELAAEGAAPVRLAALLQHPLTRPGLPRLEHLAFARRYELEVLRSRPQPDPPPGRLPAWPEAPPEAAAWLVGIEGALAPLTAALAGGALSDVVAAHLAAAETLSRDGEGAEPEVWGAAAGAALGRVMGRLTRHAEAHGAGPVRGYLALLAGLLARENLPPEAETPHPRVAIWGTREARVEAADTVILAGLNEGVWPAGPAPDPWLSRPMRAALGLASPDARIGLAAHDFLQGAARPEAILSRARKVDGTPQIAARWLVRLENLLGGLGEGAALAAMRARGQALIDLVDLVHRPAATVPRAPRPAPRPPVAARPRRLSVTQIERLLRDPYEIYARKVLRLQPLDPIGPPADYRLRGSVVHAIVHDFVDRTRAGLPDDRAAEAALMAAAEAVLAREVPWPDMRRIWRARLARVAPWFVAFERRRRAAASPAGLEVKGTLDLALPGGPFTLSARADRIDREGAGAFVIDYKTGQPPSQKQIDTGFSQQLHLQAAMLAAGAFPGIDPLPPRGGAFIGLTGSGPGGRELPVEISPEAAEEHLARVRALLAGYDRADAPYISWARPERETDSGDFDHLARRGEWEGGP